MVLTNARPSDHLSTSGSRDLCSCPLGSQGARPVTTGCRRTAGYCKAVEATSLPKVPILGEDTLNDWRTWLARSPKQRESTLRRLGMPQWVKITPEPRIGILKFDRWRFQAPESESTSGKGLPGIYSDEVAEAENVVIQKSTQVGCCLDPATKVLTADLRWIPIDEVQPGMELVSVDEFSEKGELGAKGRRRHPGRKIRKAVVQAKWDVHEPAFRLTLADGRELIATAQHRFLGHHRRHTEPFWIEPQIRKTGRESKGYWRSNVSKNSNSWKNPEWICVGDMLPGRVKITSLVPKTWDEPGYEDGWMGGILDGEAYWGKRMVFTQAPGAVYDRAVRYLQRLGIPFEEWEDVSPISGRPVLRLGVSRIDNLMCLMGKTRPSRWPHSVSFWEGRRVPRMSRKNAPPGGGEAVEVVAIEPLGKRRMVDLQTSTSTFIAEGLVSHNSAYCWRWAAWRADQYSDRVLYIFPTDSSVTDFGRDRIDPSIGASRYLSSRCPPGVINNQHLKRIGDGLLYLRGSVQTSKDRRSSKAQSVAAQSIVFDEYDDLDQRTVAQYERRLSGAAQSGATARFRRVGVPTIDGTGIAAAYARSDRRKWHVTCDGCSHEGEVLWEHVRWTTRLRDRKDPCMEGNDERIDEDDVESAWRACPECEAHVDVSNGRWLAENPESRIIGFHVPRLIVKDVNLRQMVVDSRKTAPHEMEAFFQNDLGLPYSSDETGLTLDLLNALVSKDGVPTAYSATGDFPVTMGVDVASERDLNVRISEHYPDGTRVPLYIAAVPGYQEVVNLIAQYGVDVCAIDSMPERRKAKEVAALYPGRVVLAQYNQRADSQPIVYDVVKNVASVNRTEAIDATLDAIRQGRNKLPAIPPRNYLQHLVALKRRLEISNAGIPSYHYITTGNVGDDFAHAEVFDLVAKEVFLQKAAAAQDDSETVLSGGVEAMNLTGGDDNYDPGFA
jgi:hypothetical protein